MLEIFFSIFFFIFVVAGRFVFKPVLASNIGMFWGHTRYQNLIRSYFSSLLKFVELSLAADGYFLHGCYVYVTFPFCRLFQVLKIDHLSVKRGLQELVCWGWLIFSSSAYEKGNSGH